MQDDLSVWYLRLVASWRHPHRRRRIAATLLLIIGGATGIFALATAFTLGPAIAPFSGAALAAGGALHPTPVRLLWGLFGVVVLVGWIVAVIW